MAVEILRTLWEGGYQSHYSKHYTVEQARIYTLPDEPPPLAVAASQPKAAQLAGRLGDALIATAPDEELRGEFERAGCKGKPCYGQLHVCYAESEEQARRTAHEVCEFEQAGFTHVFVHQVGQDQEGFLRFYAESILPRL